MLLLTTFILTCDDFIDDTYLCVGRSEWDDDIFDIVLMNEKSFGTQQSNDCCSSGDIVKDGVLGNGELLDEVIASG